MEKSVIQKLGLEKYQNPKLLTAPPNYNLSGIAWQNKEQPDMLFTFIETLSEFKEAVTIAQTDLLDQGVLFVAYPKKGNQLYQNFIHRDEIFPALQVNEDDGFVAGTQLKFNRMVSYDKNFTVVGLKKLVNPPTKPTKKASQRVADYQERIPELLEELAKDPLAVANFQQLTPGYQKDWARYVYSAKQQATQEKRLAEAITILQAGYKTKALYQKMLKEQQS